MVLRKNEQASEKAAPKVQGARILVLEAPYYSNITNSLTEGALAVITEVGGSATRVTVPGALELPQALAAYVHADRIGRFAGAAKAFDGAVVIGCVIRGETTHYDIVCNQSNHWLMQVAMRHGVPLGNAVLTMENEAQGLARAAGGAANKGGDAARACLRLIEIERGFQSGAGA
jgi:6,7-dimethyl-8-ribityllumazine synthase